MTRKFTVLSLALSLAAIAPALADRAPTPEELARIEAALRAEGYTRWEEIEVEDGAWEVDEAVAADGKSYDVKLDMRSYALLSREDD
jgi:hypothetical protein